MFISKLIDKLDRYDKFGEFRVNGIKALFLAELLFIVNVIFSLPNPFFYYFFVPLNMILAETLGFDLKEKYLFFILAMLLSTFSIFCFGLLSTFKLLFVFFVFIYTLLFYFILLSHLRQILLMAPLILSMASYSLLYQGNHDFYLALNHVFLALFAMVVMLIGLWFFPKTYYLSIWRRALIEFFRHLQVLLECVIHQHLKTPPLVPAALTMKRYAAMLPKSMHYFSVLKITLLSFDALMEVSYLAALNQTLPVAEFECLNVFITRTITAIKTKQPVSFSQYELDELSRFKSLSSIIVSWNYLCLDPKLQRS